MGPDYSSKPDWVVKSALVLKVGLNVVLPDLGSGLDEVWGQKLRRWREDKNSQKALADFVTTWATTRGFATGDIADGMDTAANILERKAADWDRMAELTLDPAQIAAAVLASDSFALEDLNNAARDVCERTVIGFYYQAIRAGGSELQLAATRRILVGQEKLDQLMAYLEMLRIGSDQEKRQAGRRKILEEVMNSIVELETAESGFRWVVQPGSKTTHAALGEARQSLVAASSGSRSTR